MSAHGDGPLRVALFGASARGRQCLADLALTPGVRVTAFFDNDPAKWGTAVEGVDVRRPEQGRFADIDAVVVSTAFAAPVVHQLVRLGLAAKVVMSPAALRRRVEAGDQTPGDGGRRPVAASPAATRLVEVLRGPAPRVSSLAGGWQRQTACTICSANYLAQAGVLAASYLRSHPEGRFYVCLADERPPLSLPRGHDPRVRHLTARDLGIADYEQFAFKYRTIEFNTAVKPTLLLHLLEREGAERLLYLDPDILVWAPLDDLFERLGSARFVLTPHITTPYEDWWSPSEVDLLRAGTFNLGFIGVAGDARAQEVLRWWAARVYDQCVVDPDRGLFVDQKWMDLLPSLEPQTAIVHAPEFNVAYWNLHERQLTAAGDDLLVNGRRLGFFHFSGIDLDDLDGVSRHQNRVTLPADGALRALFEAYALQLEEERHETFRRLAYAYGRFDNGVAVADVLRTAYRRLPELTTLGDPFQTASGGRSLFEWLREPVLEGRQLTNLAAALWQVSPEVRQRFPALEPATDAELADFLVAASEWFGLEFELAAALARAAAASRPGAPRRQRLGDGRPPGAGPQTIHLSWAAPVLRVRATPRGRGASTGNPLSVHGDTVPALLRERLAEGGRIVFAGCWREADDEQLAAILDVASTRRSTVIARPPRTTPDAASAYVAWWEARMIDAGWAKHHHASRDRSSSSYRRTGVPRWLAFQPIPDSVRAAFPPSALAQERDLHMDMLREAGPRSEVHLQRYAWALDRLPAAGAALLDGACGLGYGSAMLGRAHMVWGIDEGRFAIEYATEAFGSASCRFARGDVCREGDWPDVALDAVVSFETLEHLDRPELFLDIARRRLRPGGLLVGSVPNQWADARGRDPNPHHRRVFDAHRLVALLRPGFTVEQLWGQAIERHGQQCVVWPLPRLAPGWTPEWLLFLARRRP